MSDLFTRLTRLYTGGLTRPAPALWPDPRTRAIAQFKPAAVLVAITDRPTPGLLLIHRPETMRAHRPRAWHGNRGSGGRPGGDHHFAS